MEPQNNNEKTVVLQDEGLRKLKGFVQIPRFVLLCKNLSYGAKVAYGILLGYAWQDEFCFPAQKSLADDLGCSVRQAQRFLDELKKEEFITWKQVGFNRPNVYYILSLPTQKGSTSQHHPTDDGGGNPLKNKDTTNMSHPDTTDLSTPDTTNMSGQEATNMSTYKYSYTNKQNNVNVNADKEEGSENRGEGPKTDLRKLPDLVQDKAITESIAQEIVNQLGDRKSFAFYYLVASKIPEHVIYTALSSIKQSGANFPPKVFATRMKEYASESLRKQNMQRRMSLDQYSAIGRMPFH
jgi:helix-turn-helix protein